MYLCRNIHNLVAAMNFSLFNFVSDLKMKKKCLLRALTIHILMYVHIYVWMDTQLIYLYTSFLSTKAMKNENFIFDSIVVWTGCRCRLQKRRDKPKNSNELICSYTYLPQTALLLTNFNLVHISFLWKIILVR